MRLEGDASQSCSTYVITLYNKSRFTDQHEIYKVSTQTYCYRKMSPQCYPNNIHLISEFSLNGFPQIFRTSNISSSNVQCSNTFNAQPLRRCFFNPFRRGLQNLNKKCFLAQLRDSLWEAQAVARFHRGLKHDLSLRPNYSVEDGVRRVGVGGVRLPSNFDSACYWQWIHLDSFLERLNCCCVSVRSPVPLRSAQLTTKIFEYGFRNMCKPNSSNYLRFFFFRGVRVVVLTCVLRESFLYTLNYLGGRRY